LRFALKNKLSDIADTLDMPICHLLVSPNEVALSGDFVAFIKDGSKTFHSNGLVELEKITKELKGEE